MCFGYISSGVLSLLERRAHGVPDFYAPRIRNILITHYFPELRCQCYVRMRKKE